MFNSRLINTKVAGGGGCTDIVDNYDPFGGDGVALYQLNGNADDVSGNYDGTATSVTYGAGEFGQAAVFNGSNSVVTLPSALSDGVTTDATCISFWFNVGSEITSATPNNEIMNFAQSSSNSGKIAIGSTTGNFAGETFSVTSDVTSQYTYITENIPAGWNHAVVQWNSFTAKWDIYINSVAKSTNTFGTNEQGKLALKFGNRSSYYYNGSLDQVRIFNRALRPYEVESLYTEELCVCGGTVDTLDILDDSSCIALYPLDGNANDLSGNYPGTPTDVSYGVGEFDLAGVFNGSSSYVEILNSNYDVRGNFSLSLWFNLNDLSANQTLFAKILNTSEKPLTIRVLTDGRLLVEQEGNNSNYNKFSTNTVSAGNWYNLVWTADASFNGELFINKVSFLTTNPGTVNINNGVPSLIGIMGAPGSVYNGSSPFNGSIDQVRIFNKALSAGEVTTLYDETACTPAACTSGTTNTLDILGDGSCIAAYPLDGTPADLSGNYNGVQTDVTYPQGYFDLAGSFNGSSSIIDISSLSIPLNNFSYSLWFKANDTSSYQNLFLHENGGRSYGVQLNNDANIGSYMLNSSAGAQYLLSNSITIDTNWHNVVITKSSTQGHKIYYDGNNIATDATFTGNLLSGTFSNFLGSSGAAGYFNGQIDQVRIFNKALSASEVTTLYNETACN